MELRAPLSGVIVPLDDIPDGVFAKRLVGDGVSIDPTSAEVLAPVAGTLTQLHASHHALAVTSPEGVEVLIHVGLDTVAMRGQGFTPLVALGAPVTLGQPLLRFDPEVVAAGARSLLTEVLITTGERVRKLTPAIGTAVAGKTVLLTLELVPEAPAPARPAAPGAGAAVSRLLTLPNEEGLHARPAAVLAARAKQFAAELRLTRGEQAADAKSVVALLGLGTRRGDQLRFTAQGADAQAAVDALSALLLEGSGEAPAPPKAKGPVLVPPPRPPAPPAEGELAGDSASPGLAIGRVVQHRPGTIQVPEKGGTVAEERARLEGALREASLQLEGLRRGTPADRAQILAVHQELLEDPGLVDATQALIKEGASAAHAWSQAVAAQAGTLERLERPLLRERAADLRDVGRRVLGLLCDARPTMPVLPPDAVLIADEVSPSEMAALDRGKLQALCTTSGSSTSHVAILARSMGIPAVCAIDRRALELAEGTQVIVDGTAGRLQVPADEASLVRARDRMQAEATRRDQERAAAFAEGATRDGHRVEVAANISNLEDARAAVAGGAEGVGLLRSEFMFYDRPAAPSEDEQAAAYLAMAEVLGPKRPLVVRTLDVGGDKPIGYLPLPKESNPFLGLRGIRVSLDKPQLFQEQLRAILRASLVGNMHLMFPMISGLDELRAARKLLAELQPPATARPVKVGVMIEVPSAVLLADALAREVDFFSIGTNDLTQYTLAMDRGHPLLAKQADALHPAVLRMIQLTVEAAHRHGKWVGVCGGIASDPLAVPALVGLGVDELSVSVPAIASVKASLARWTLPECQAQAAAAVALSTPAEVRSMLKAQQPSAGAPPRRPAAAEGR